MSYLPAIPSNRSGLLCRGQDAFRPAQVDDGRDAEALALRRLQHQVMQLAGRRARSRVMYCADAARSSQVAARLRSLSLV